MTLYRERKRGGAKRGRGSSQTRKMISFITRISGNVIHGIITSTDVMQLSRERATTNDGSDLQVLRFYDDLQKRFAAGSYPTASKVN